jgi:hypothetical protein
VPAWPSRFATLALACAALLGAGCVDGTTPDCSDAASHCGPDFDAYPDDSANDGAAVDSSVDGPSDGAMDVGSDSAGDAPSEAATDAGAG